ncbi:cystatin-2-like [Dendrobates tinctorius]|uniref:cystatin-2-like n=1 Tax=Dendrobates tinctorius TaxID=92724 RepID=UPI003CCA2CA1
MARLYVVAAVLLCLSVVTQAGRFYGGREKADVDSPSVKQALNFALNDYNKASNDLYQARVVKISNAEKQVVSGVMFYFDVDVGRTQCRKPITNGNDCELHTDANLAKTTTCHFEVYTVPWRSHIEMTASKCA